MHQEIIYRIIVILVLILLIDIYSYHGIKRFSKRLKGTTILKCFSFVHWFVTIAFVLALVIFVILTKSPGPYYIKSQSYFMFYGFFILIFLPRLIFCVFLFFEDILNLLIGIFKKRKPSFSIRKPIKKRSRIFSIIGLLAAIFVFFQLSYGIIFGKTNFKVRNETICFENLPESFDGLKILHFSDTHIGSFSKLKQVEKGVDLIKNQDAALIVFTGDMINSSADEIIPYINIFREIKAPLGIYSVLGNHDMDDYMKWNNYYADEKEIERLINLEKSMGFEILRNENIIIKKDNDSIALIGVGNWGLPPFKKYGDLQKAMNGVKNVSFKILLSHDPSHWDSEVLNKTDIALTLSGHTHGMQFGINCCGIKWSPVKFIYPRWMGVYNENNQYLNVSAGFGFLAFPGRVGIYPEVSVITLKRK